MNEPSSDLRFGLEVEMHAIEMTFKFKNLIQVPPNPTFSDCYWEIDQNGKPRLGFMDLDDILIPAYAEDYHVKTTSNAISNVKPPVPKANWESDWGFRVTVDALHQIVCSKVGASQKS